LFSAADKWNTADEFQGLSAPVVWRAEIQLAAIRRASHGLREIGNGSQRGNKQTLAEKEKARFAVGLNRRIGCAENLAQECARWKK